MMGGLAMFLGGILMLLFVIGTGALVVLGVAWLVRNAAHGVQSGSIFSPMPTLRPTTIRSCRSCGRTVEQDWSHCAHCGSPHTYQSRLCTPKTSFD